MKKILIAVVILLAVLMVGWYYINDEPLPEPVDQKALANEVSSADILANKMLKAIHKEAWDELRYVQWTFQDKRHFVWDKQEHLVQVIWEDYQVLIDPNTSEGVAYVGEALQQGEEADELVGKAIDAFNNDSFWLNAPSKIYDHGTERSIVDHEGKDALMVKYTTGGSTPGDSYLWVLDDDGLPLKWKMWVSNIPVGGVEVTWEAWGDFDGAKLSQLHKSEVFDLNISNIRVGMHLADLEITEDIFAELRN